MGYETPSAAEKLVRLLAAVLAGLVCAPFANAASPSIQASVDPTSTRFGDPFTYVVEARFPRDAEGAIAAQVVADPGPFAALTASHTGRSTVGDDVVVTVTQLLACVSTACVPAGTSRAVSLPPARAEGGGSVATAAPVVVHVGARVAEAAVREAEPRFRTPTEIPSPTMRFEPRPVAAVLGSAGLLLVVAGIALVAYTVVRGAARASRGDPNPLARALRLLRESSGRPPADRRRAAGLLSRLLAAGGGASLAAEAQQVAWSRPDPSPSEAEVLADRTQRALGGEP